MEDRSIPPKLLLAFATVGIAVFCLAAVLTAQDQYVSDFYRAFSPVTWGAFSVAVLASMLLIFQGRESDLRTDWRTGILLLFALYAVFWELPHLAGLRFWTSPVEDLLHHYGFAGFVVNYGQIPPKTAYPLVHVFLAEFNLVTGADLGAIGSAVSFGATVTIVLGIVCLSRRLFRTPQIGASAAFVAVTLIYGKFYHHIFPWFISFALIPLILMLVHESQYSGSKLRSKQTGLLVLVLGVTLFHPMTALVVMGTGLLLVVAKVTWTWRQKGRFLIQTEGTSWILSVPLIHFVWYFDRAGVERHITNIAVALTESTSAGGATVSRAASSSYTLTQLIWRYVVLQYGPLLLFCGVAGFVVVYIGYRWFRGKGREGTTVAGFLYIGGGFLAIMMYVGYFVASGAYRANQVTILGASLVLGWMISRLRQQNGSSLSLIGRAVLVLAILSVAVYSPFTIYAANHHIDEQEFTGTDWFLETRDLEDPVESVAMTHKPAIYLNDGVLRPGVTPRNWAFRAGDLNTDAHYGYDENSSVATTFAEDTYIITKTRDFQWWKLQPRNKYPYMNYQTRSDYQGLGSDPSANKVYANGGFSVWRVQNGSEDRSG